MTTTYVGFLRGINVGGKNKLPMKDLANLFAERGCEKVQTYIQSGNILFTAPPRLAERIAVSIRTDIAERFAIRTQLIVRTRDEIRAVLLQNPFLTTPDTSEDLLHVYFLSEAPAKDAVAALEPDRSPPDKFIVKGREIYLRLPNGMGRTKLTNDYFDRKLKTISTARNWRIITNLYEMMQH